MQNVQCYLHLQAGITKQLLVALFICHTPPPVGSGDLPYLQLFVRFFLVEVHREKWMELHHLFNVSFSCNHQIQGARTAFLTRMKHKTNIKHTNGFPHCLLVYTEWGEDKDVIEPRRGSLQNTPKLILKRLKCRIYVKIYLKCVS